MQRLRALMAGTAFGIVLPFAAAGETFYLSQPGLCSADEGVIEESDAIYLQDRSINSHFFGCDLAHPVLAALASGKEFSIRGTCSNATKTWRAEFTLVPQRDGNVKVHQDGGGLSPVLFYRCLSD